MKIKKSSKVSHKSHKKGWGSYRQNLKHPVETWFLLHFASIADDNNFVSNNPLKKKYEMRKSPQGSRRIRRRSK